MKTMKEVKQHKTQIFQDHHHQNSWCFIAKSDQESIKETSNESSSISSCSSFDTSDDASSSSTTSTSSLDSNESSKLDLSDLMAHLPIKRGLSMFYHGKSESFTSLSSVISIEDLPKRIKNPFSKMRKMKDNFKIHHTIQKPTISKKFSPFLRQRSFTRSTLVSSQQNN